ncbi:hypothetical protein [Chryseobacterium bernardetii]|uniref:hypothetical protein n=1 Tax=Chryseobacterium bernardetii TaxID=1241978 RepID=UPI003AF591B6
MKKNLVFRVAILGTIAFSLLSCRTEDEVTSSPMQTVNRFQVFTSRNGEPVNYSRGYKVLLEKYDSIHATAYTKRTLLRSGPLGKTISEEYVELGIRSQELMMKNDNERWILYPVAKGKEIIGIEVGILKNQETELEFWRMDSQDAYYKDIIDLFRLAYNKKMLTEQAMGRGGNCGHTGEEPCDTGEVVITVPKPGGPKGDPNLYLPGANPGSGDPGVIGGGCQMYGDCGGGTGETPSDKPEDPCAKTKNKISNQKFKAKFQELNTPEMFAMNHEKGYYEKLPPAGSNLASGFPVVDGAPCAHDMDLPDNEDGIAGLMHIHNDVNCDGNPSVKIPSPSDVRTFLNIFMKQSRIYTGSYTNAYSVVITSQGSYMLQYTNDTWPGSTWDKIDDWNNWYKKEYEKLTIEELANSSIIEKIFTQFLKEKVAIEGLEVYKITENSSTKLEYNGSKQPIITTPCP